VTPALMASGPAQAFVVQALGFVVVVVVIVKFVLPALRKILGGRTHEIEQTFQKIEKDTQETNRQMAEIKLKLAQVAEESQRRTKAAMDDAERTRAQALADAQAQVQAALDRAMREVHTERDKAVLDLRQQAIELTLRAAEHLVQATMNDPIHENLVVKYLDRVDTVKKS
jgi:F-type H+-transporting ATPase subunit b